MPVTQCSDIDLSAVWRGVSLWLLGDHRNHDLGELVPRCAVHVALIRTCIPMVCVDDSGLVSKTSRSAKLGVACPSDGNETSMIIARVAALVLWMLTSRLSQSR